MVKFTNLVAWRNLFVPGKDAQEQRQESGRETRDGETSCSLIPHRPPTVWRFQTLNDAENTLDLHRLTLGAKTIVAPARALREAATTPGPLDPRQNTETLSSALFPRGNQDYDPRRTNADTLVGRKLSTRILNAHIGGKTLSRFKRFL